MESSIKKLVFNNKEYEVDWLGFLINPNDWDENFAKSLTSDLSIPDGLTDEHMKVIYFIREFFLKTKVCPNIYTTCRNNNLKLKDLRILFPTGYHRGACKIAGISYRDGYLTHYYCDNIQELKPKPQDNKIYRVDVNGFLIYAGDWDKAFALNRAGELKMPELLTEKHFEVIDYLRDSFTENGNIPNVFETCEHFNFELEDLEKLFPDGYHRGAIKIAGLRIDFKMD